MKFIDWDRYKDKKPALKWYFKQSRYNYRTKEYCVCHKAYGSSPEMHISAYLYVCEKTGQINQMNLYVWEKDLKGQTRYRDESGYMACSVEEGKKVIENLWNRTTCLIKRLERR